VSIGVAPAPVKSNSFTDPTTKQAVPGSTIDALADFEAKGKALVVNIRAKYPP
jgi:hypothetical protein